MKYLFIICLFLVACEDSTTPEYNINKILQTNEQKVDEQKRLIPQVKHAIQISNRFMDSVHLADANGDTVSKWRFADSALLYNNWADSVVDYCDKLNGEVEQSLK